MLLRCRLLQVVAVWLALAGPAWAGPETTRASLDRLGELLSRAVQSGELDREALSPALVVSVQPRSEDTASWYGVAALEVLQGALGTGTLRLCEACMAPRTDVGAAAVTLSTGPLSVPEIIALDDRLRGSSPPARAAIWLDEQPGGVSVRIVDLASAQVRYARTVDPDLLEYRNTRRIYTLSEELERRGRGDALTQSFVDVGFLPFARPHISLDWTDQWGPTNANLSGITLTLVDPVVGLGGVHYRRIKFLDTLVGGKVVVSLPTALVSSISQGTQIIDPPLTAIGVVRVPFGRSNYGVVGTVSTNGAVSLGVSLLNISLLPVIP